MIDQKQIVGVVEKLSGEIFCSKMSVIRLSLMTGPLMSPLPRLTVVLRGETKVNCVVMEIELSQRARS